MNNPGYINIPFDDLDILTQRIRNMSVAELEKTNTKQERTVKVFIEKCQTARVEPKNLSELFKAYVEMIYHFHLRWTYARAIAHVLDETMKELGLPSEQRANMFTLIQCEGDLESTKWIAETNILSERLANVPSQSRTVKGLANHDADLLRDILKYASLYRLVDIDDMSAAPAVELAVINLAKGVKQGIPGKESVANIQFHFPPEVYNNLDLWRILAVNEIGGRIKDDAHHFQPRGQFLMREQLLTLGKYLVEQRILSEADDIFDRLPEDIIRYAGSYFQQVQRSKT